MSGGLAALALAALLSASAAPEDAGARVAKLGKIIRCPVCQGLSIADSPSDMARSMLKRVGELVEEGRSDDEILAYFEDRYGEWVRLSPKPVGANWLVWLGPSLLLAGGLAFVWVLVSRRTRAAVRRVPEAPRADPSGPAEPADDRYLAAVRREVDP